MADSAEKGFVAVPVPMNPEDHPKGQDPPPYTGPTVAWLSAPPHVLQPCVRDAVQLTVPIAPPPRDYVLWSFVSAMVCNFYCLGFAALAFSVKSRDRLVMKDVAAAHRYGNSARRLNIAAVVVGVITITFFLLKVAVIYFSA